FALRQYEMRGPLDLLLRRHVKPGEEFARNAWECTGCGACEEVCPVDIPFDGLWDDVKAWMVSSGYARPELEPYLANVRETHNLYGEPAANRAAWLPPETVQSPTPEVVYWVGCAASYKRQQIARAMVKILNAAKVPYRILGAEEWCTGAPLARMGYEDVTKKELMPHNVHAVEETGAKVLVTACAECYRAFARDYKQWGGNPPFSVFHISHYVEKLIREKRIAFTKPLPQKVAFHDACHMSRVTKVYEAPRQALKFIKDLKVLEILPHHEDALCSGAGGGFPAVFPEQAARVAERRLDADEDPDVLSRDDEVGRPRGIREVHSVLHAAAAAGDDAQPERGLGAALLLLQHPNPPHGAVRDDQRVFLRGHHRDRVSESFEGPP